MTEENNWTGPDGEVKDLVMLINGMNILRHYNINNPYLMSTSTNKH